MESTRAYEWTGYNGYLTDPNVAGRVMEELERTVGLTTKNLVEASRPEDAPLHKEFEWNDEIAGEKFREIQAGKMITNLKVVTVQDEPRKVRGFVTLEYAPGRPGTFEKMETVLEDKTKRNRLLTMAIKELQAFRRKYITLSELTELFELIDKIEKESA